MLGLVMAVLFINFGPANKPITEKGGSVREHLTRCNPLRVFEMMCHPNVLATVCSMHPL